MGVQEQIDKYISDQHPSKRRAMAELHRRIIGMVPGCRLWFLDGRNAENKIVSNPSIGYGTMNLKYADGSEKEFYKVGLSANTSGLSLYLMGIADKTYLSKTYGPKLGKAKITGYCIKLRSMADVSLETLDEIIADHLAKA